MESKIANGKLAIFLGGLTLIMFAAKPYVLELIEPTKSIGQVIGENAKDLIETMSGKNNLESSSSKREVWSNIITILSFIFFAVTIFFSMKAIQNESKRWFGVGGILLAIVGLGIYLSHLAVGLISLIVIGVLVVGVVVMLEG